MSDDATVASVLDAVNDNGEAEKLRAVAMGDTPQPDMDYEDWVRPLKLTGGRVCLRVEYDEQTEWLQYTRNGMIHGMFRDEHGRLMGPQLVAPGDLPAVFEKYDVQPVLREDTPFAEVDDGR